MRGFQLWVNLPAREKMKPAAYRDIQPEEIPAAALPGGGLVRVLAGAARVDGKEVPGPIQGLSTAPLFLDVRLPAGGRFVQPVAADHNVFVYPYEGAVRVGPAGEERPLESRAAGLLSLGDEVEISTGEQGAAFLILAARPLQEPVVQYGPFVMNSREEIEQAIQDYQNGRFF